VAPGRVTAGPCATNRVPVPLREVSRSQLSSSTLLVPYPAALQALRLGTSVVLDYGLWGRDERSALRWLARSAGAACQVVYVPVDKNVQLARIAHRQETAPHLTFPMSESEVDRWREQFQVPDVAELDGGEFPVPQGGLAGLAGVGRRLLALVH
jgi:predicted kinase